MDLQALVERFDAVDGEREAEILNELIVNGWEAGCWLRPPEDRIILASQPEIDRVFAHLRGRKSFARTPVTDPYPNGRPREPIDGEEPCFVVVSQRCDIVGLLKNEPLVELAPASICTDAGRISQAWKNSPREFPVDPRANPTHLIDIRY